MSLPHHCKQTAKSRVPDAALKLPTDSVDDSVLAGVGAGKVRHDT